jgi:tape measure domain-containing protein
VADVAKTVSIIFQGEDKTSAALRSVESGLDGIGTGAAGATTKLGAVGDEVEEIGKKGASIDGLADAFQALGAAIVLSAFVDANVQAEKFEKAMTLLKGSSEAAAEEFAYISSVSQVLGLRLFEAADAYTQITAATKGTALEGQATRDIFESVSTAFSVLGKSSVEVEGALLAVMQMVSKNTVSMEELRGQLGERLPGAFQIAADAMGLTTKELDELVSSGNLTASEFLPKFAKALQDTFGDTTYVESYTASWNRLQNSLNDAFIVIGKAGVFDAITKGVQAANASLTGLIGLFQILDAATRAMSTALQTGDFSGIGPAIDAAMAKAAESTASAVAALTGADQAAVDLKYSGEAAGKAVADGMAKGAEGAEDLSKASKEVDALLKTIGLDPKQFKDPIAEVVSAFEALAKNPAVTGEQFLSGLLVTLDQIKDADSLNAVFEATAAAFKDGRLNAEQYSAALGALESKQDGTWEAMQRTTAQTKEQAAAFEKSAKETQKAEEAAAKLALELEKLASNERIALIEANVQLNVAQVEADAQKTIAAFESISAAIDSTGTTLTGLFGLMGNDNLSFREMFKLEAEADKESKRRDEALNLQKDLTEAQIRMMDAQTNAINNGDGMIKVTGDGLQPHLEAFMWEILKAIQVRVNADGLKMLLGT